MSRGEGDIASIIACRESGDDAIAITGRDTGASTSPAIIRIASNRRMAKAGFTNLNLSQSWGERKLPNLKRPRTKHAGHRAVLIRINPMPRVSCD